MTNPGHTVLHQALQSLEQLEATTVKHQSYSHHIMDDSCDPTTLVTDPLDECNEVLGGV